MIYTQCPECKKVSTISVEQLRELRGMSYCTVCQVKFDALESLSEASPVIDESVDDSMLAKKTNLLGFKYQPDIADNQGPLPWEKKKLSPPAKLWRYAVLASLFLLFGQVYYFEYQNFAQNAKTRPWLKKGCAILPCQIPDYHNLSEIKVLQGSLQAISDKAYQLRTVFTNQADFAQAYPNIKLVLLTITGTPLVSRIFTPVEYLQKEPVQAMSVDETVQLHLDIVKPESPIGGYQLELI